MWFDSNLKIGSGKCVVQLAKKRRFEKKRKREVKIGNYWGSCEEDVSIDFCVLFCIDFIQIDTSQNIII
jgi:hypothetical protein